MSFMNEEQKSQRFIIVKQKPNWAQLDVFSGVNGS